jgi:hypothetical protein
MNYSNFDLKLRPSERTKSFPVENNAIFEVFRKVLIDRLLRDCLSVNVQFTKSKFAKGKVSLHERPCFVV